MKEEGWEKRYVRVCENEEREYKLMMLWVWEYYKGVEKEERMYEYEYGPLMKSIKRNSIEEEEEKEEKVKILSREEKKEYIMPKENVEVEYKWAYKRYFWEANLKIK